MKKLVLLPFTLSLFACGGGGGSSKDDGIDKNVPGDNVTFIDCSADQSGITSMPLPEYPGSYSAYDAPVDVPGSSVGFSSEAFAELTAGGLLIGIAASNEGWAHSGPIWNIVDEDLTTQIQYSIIDTTETWLVVKDGMDDDGTIYSNHTDLKIEQTASCGLNILQYDDGGRLTGHYESSAYEWTWKVYEDGVLSGLIETNINQDRSGKTVSEDLSASKSDYPVTIITWDETGEQTLLKTCKTKAGTNCMTAVAS
ncbi:MAG: hypothetical protein ACJA1U_001683 [Bermanella sp.]|jgi:hypothetical protein